MTNEETIAYFKEHNEILVSVAKDENVYDYEKQVIEADCMREKFEANEKAIKALEQEPKILNTLDFAVDASNGDTNYFVGFRNGLRYSKSLIDGEEPQFERCAEQQPCEDCISREEALRHRHIIHDDDGIGYSVVRVDEIIELPSVQPQPKRGKWIRPYKFSAIYECSLCYKQIPITDGFYEFYYCPNCGCRMDADMREEQDGE